MMALDGRSDELLKGDQLNRVACKEFHLRERVREKENENEKRKMEIMSEIRWRDV